MPLTRDSSIKTPNVEMITTKKKEIYGHINNILFFSAHRSGLDWRFDYFYLQIQTTATAYFSSKQSQHFLSLQGGISDLTFCGINSHKQCPHCPVRSQKKVMDQAKINSHWPTCVISRDFFLGVPGCSRPEIESRPRHKAVPWLEWSDDGSRSSPRNKTLLQCWFDVSTLVILSRISL